MASHIICSNCLLFICIYFPYEKVSPVISTTTTCNYCGSREASYVSKLVKRHRDVKPLWSPRSHRSYRMEVLNVAEYAKLFPSEMNTRKHPNKHLRTEPSWETTLVIHTLYFLWLKSHLHLLIITFIHLKKN